MIVKKLSVLSILLPYLIVKTKLFKSLFVSKKFMVSITKFKYILKKGNLFGLEQRPKQTNKYHNP